MIGTEWRDQLVGWRHIAYRAKVKYVHETRPLAWLRDFLWPLATEAQGLSAIHHHEEPLFDGFPFTEIGDPVARASITANSRKWSVHADAIYQANGDILIEPGHALAVLDRRFLVEPTRGSAHKILVPPLSAKWRGRAGSATVLPSIIHFDGFLGTNLFHFIADGLNPYLMMRESGLVDMAQPLLIHRQVHSVPYVRELLRLPCFDGAKWKIQEQGEYVATRRMTKGVASFAQFRKSYDLMAGMVEKTPHRRIFLDRRPVVQRRLTNMDEIAPILARHGFETIFAEDLSYRNQAALFAQTSHLVGLHGAGLTNLLFCDLPRTRVLELTSKGLMNPHFYWMSNILSVGRYDVLAGTDFDIDWNYRIDPARFEGRLRAMIAS